MMITVFLKSTTRPWESVRRPSSRICSSELKRSARVLANAVQRIFDLEARTDQQAALSPHGRPPRGRTGMSVSVDTKAGVPHVLAGRLHDPAYRGFASDNYAGAHPEIIEAVQAANEGHVTAYGEDVYSAALQEVIQSHLGTTATAYPVFNGTGANVLALQALLPRWGAVICAATAHINTDENGAPERIGGIKLLPIPTPDGKLTPELIDAEAWGWGDEHRAQPLAVSITQTTELGTCYTPEEIQQIAEHVHAKGMKLHLGRSKAGQRCSTSRASFAGIHHRRRCRRPVFWRHQKRAAVRRSRYLAQPTVRPRHELPAQDEHAACLKDPFRLCAAGSPANGWVVAAVRQSRQRDGSTSQRRNLGH